MNFTQFKNAIMRENDRFIFKTNIKTRDVELYDNCCGMKRLVKWFSAEYVHRNEDWRNEYKHFLNRYYGVKGI